MITDRWQPPAGYPDVTDGSSFIMVAGFDKDGKKCAKDRTILTYSESANPNSKHYADQTRMFSQQAVAQPAVLPQPGGGGGEEHEGDSRRLTGTFLAQP